jgi:hypothetical protein
MMQSVNSLNAFLTANSPTQANNPLSYAVEQALTAGTSGSSLAALCSDYGTSNCQTAVQQFEENTGLCSSLQTALDAFGSSYADSGNTTIQTDIANLQGDLQDYNWYMQQANHNPASLTNYLTEIATDINQLDTDAKNASPALSDGYLTTLMTYLNTPLQAGGTETLQSLSAAVLSQTPPTTADLDALNSALGVLGEQGSNNGGALMSMILFTQKYEYPT